MIDILDTTPASGWDCRIPGYLFTLVMLDILDTTPASRRDGMIPGDLFN
jgi:hypothetical protein